MIRGDYLHSMISGTLPASGCSVPLIFLKVLQKILPPEKVCYNLFIIMEYGNTGLWKGWYSMMKIARRWITAVLCLACTGAAALSFSGAQALEMPRPLHPVSWFLPYASEGLMEEDTNLVPLAVARTEESGVKRSPWQAEVTFPGRKGYTDDTLGMDSMYSFFGYHGQGYIVVEAKPGVESFRMYVNGNRIDTSSCIGAEPQTLDIAPYTVDGKNTIQISNVYPLGSTNKVKVCIPYPQIGSGTIEEEGISAQAVELISDLIQTDIEYGFTSAQLAVIRHGRLVLSEAWGRTNASLPDGSADPAAEDATAETMYELDSATEEFIVNCVMQKLAADGSISPDAAVTELLGDDPGADTAEPDVDLATLGQIVEQVTGTDLDTYLKQTFFEPMGLERIAYKPQEDGSEAGFSASAEDLAKLASVMLCGGYGENNFFDKNAADLLTAPENTGTCVMIDPEKELIAVYLTDKNNTPAADDQEDADQSEGSWYTAGTPGFVPQILSIGMDADADISEQLLDLTADMAVSAAKLVDPKADPEGDHPSVLNAKSKAQVFEKRAAAWDDMAYAYELRDQLDDTWDNLRIAYAVRAAQDAEPSGNRTNEMKIEHAIDLSEEDGADSVEREGDHPDSPYFNRLDFYNMESTDTLTILPHFKTIQQSSEWSCGVASSLMVLNWYGKLGEYNEETLAQLRPQGDTPGATSLSEMIAIFDGVGGFNCYSAIDAGEEVYDIFTFDYIQETLKAGNPIMIGWNDWGGHWQVIIGYDNMGTKTTQDDVIIVADPYDTTDHNQDGYGVYGAERFLYNFTFYNFFEGEELNDMCFLVATPEA